MIMMMTAETPAGKHHHALTQGSDRAGQALLISTSQLTSLRLQLSVSAIRNSQISLHCSAYISVYTLTIYTFVKTDTVSTITCISLLCRSLSAVINL